jgi:hypothetical protein
MDGRAVLMGEMRRTRVEDLEAEIHGYMPKTFVLMYYDLVRTSLKGTVDSVEKSRRNAGGMSGAPPGSEGAVLLSETSLERKRVIDRKLRELAREGGTDAQKTPPKCASCNSFGREDWKYCARCGAVWRREGEGVEGGGVRVVEGRGGTDQVKRWGEGESNGHTVSVDANGRRWIQLR